MATVEQCRVALTAIVAMLDEVEPEVRERHVPARRVACRLTDLDHWFVGELRPDGVYDVAEAADGEPDADVRVAMTSDELVALSTGADEFLPAWLRGRVTVSASVRDLLRLRSLFGL